MMHVGLNMNQCAIQDYLGTAAPKSSGSDALLLARVKWFLKLGLGALMAQMPSLGQASCWEQAAQRYRLDPLLLQAIGWQESRGWSHAIGPKLAGGHRALGVMQINTVHLTRLRQHGIDEKDLFEPCTNQMVGAWVLADCMRQFGETWRSVGCYYAGPHSTRFERQVAYVQDVQRHYQGYLRQRKDLAAQPARPTTVGGQHRAM